MIHKLNKNYVINKQSNLKHDLAYRNHLRLTIWKTLKQAFIVNSPHVLSLKLHLNFIVPKVNDSLAIWRNASRAAHSW